MNNNVAILNQRPATSDHNTVLVSIIIPAYNTAEYIHRAIESSIRQTHSNIEILIIDDGSTDDTLKVSQSYAEKDSRIRVIHQNNGGVSSARNHGMREANGEYYVFLDSDDWLEDNAVEVLLDAQIEHPDKLIAANYYDVSTDYLKYPADNENVKTRVLKIEEVAESLVYIRENNSIPVTFRVIHAKIFRADIIRNGIDFPEGIIFGEDTVFVFDYLNLIGGAFYINKIVFNVFERPDSAIRSTNPESISKNLHSLIKIHKIMMNHSENTPAVKKLIGISGCQLMIADTTNNDLSRSDKEAVRNYMKYCAAYFLTCKKISFRQKLSFIYRTYLPFSLSKAISCLWEILKRIHDKMRRK